MEYPALPDHKIWSQNVYCAHERMAKVYSRGVQLLMLQEPDPLRIQTLLNAINHEHIPILEALAHQTDDPSEDLPHTWIVECVRHVADLIVNLEATLDLAVGRERDHVLRIAPVQHHYSKKRGRPPKVIDRQYLTEAVSARSRIPVASIAKMLDVHRSTVHKYLKQYQLTERFSPLPRDHLDQLVKVFRTTKPGSGYRHLMGSLAAAGLHIQQHRVLASIKRVDRIGHALQRRFTLLRRRYEVKRPNALWHCDGHHKLILWGIVIHGFIDGWSRMVTGLRASNNNRASTVLDLFLQAMENYGKPSRVRGDRGGENKDVSVWITAQNGVNRASFIWGSSTHNTRIERLWVEVGRQFARRWRAFFYRLERLHGLNRRDPSHLWLLHVLFMHLINADCKDFQDSWNAHSIQGSAAQNRTPHAMMLLGVTQQGIYADPMSGVSPHVLEKYYGVHGRKRTRLTHQTGAGNPHDEEDSENDDRIMASRIEQEQACNFLHQPVEAPHQRCPFNDEQTLTFNAVFRAVKETGQLPDGYGIHAADWMNEQYPTTEVLLTGRRSTKQLIVDLPIGIWLPRARLWCQALDVMMTLKDLIE